MIKAITSELTEDDLNDFLPIALKMSKYPDPDTGIEEYWSFPQLVDTPALMYNKHHFELAGIDLSELTIETSWTWEEYWSILATVNSTDDGIYATTLAGMFFGAQPFYFGHGGNLFTNDTVKFETIAINTTEAREGFMFVKNLTDSLYTPRWEEQGWSTINILFNGSNVITGVVANAQGNFTTTISLDITTPGRYNVTGFVTAPPTLVNSSSFSVDLKAYWTFNETSGTEALDSFEGAYNLTGLGGEWQEGLISNS